MSSNQQTLHVSTIDVSLAKTSHGTIASIKLSKNDKPLEDVPHPVYEGGIYRIEFDSPLAVCSDDRISVSVNCTWQGTLRKRVANIPVTIDLRDSKCRRNDEQGVRLYRKTERKVEVVVACQSLLATTASIIQSCPNFRLLVIGNSGVGKSLLINKVFGVEGVHVSDSSRGRADIDQEFISPKNSRIVVHDSPGFETGDERNIDIVRDFVARRKVMPQLKDRLHVIWLCLQMPYAGGRLLEAGAEKVLQRRKEILGNVPLVVVLTKTDLLDMQLELDLPEDEDLERCKSDYMDKHCIGPLHNAAGSDVPHVTVSTLDDYAESLSNLLRVTRGNMVKNNIEEWSRIVDNNDPAAGGGRKTSLHNSYDTLSSRCVVESQDESSSDKTARLEKVIQKLRGELSDSQRAADETVVSLRSQEKRANTEIAELKAVIRELRTEFADYQHAADEQIERQDKLLRLQEMKTSNEIAKLKEANQELQHIIRAHERVRWCESLHAQGHVFDAAELILEIENTMSEHIKTNQFFSNWLTEITPKCVETLEKTGDKASSAEKWEEAAAAFAAALSFNSSISNVVLGKWARAILTGRSPREAFGVASKFKVPMFDVYRAICTVLEQDGRVKDIAETLRRMQTNLLDHTSANDEQAQWAHDFQERCVEKWVKLGDTARDTKAHEDAIKHYSLALSFRPTNETLLKRGNELIELDPSSHVGYEQKHAALNGLGRYSEAFKSFQTMLSKLQKSSNAQICELRQQFLDITPLIQKMVYQIVSPMPRVLIDAATGCLYDKEQQAAAFEKLAIYDELRSSMTTRATFDQSRIRDEVRKFYRYVMFSHRWEYGEPLFQKVQKITVYDLESSAPNIKLQTFCALIRALGFQWVWSDTCCIDKKDNVVLQESLVAMFTWYRGSSLTLVYLRGIWSHSQKPGDLRGSVWNTRAWTYQEYVAAENVQFYTEDWKPYLGLDVFNHKASPAIISELEQASRVSRRELATLRPGLQKIREKLFLASTRQTTFVEDIAYSLLGIFNVSISVIYGERYRAVGRLLEHILTGSGNVTILAWTGCAGEYNSCLPLDLTVYDQVVPPHVPPPIAPADIDNILTAMRSSSQLDFTHLQMLHSRLHQLALPSMAASRLRLSGLVFLIPDVVCTSEPDPMTNVGVYRATTTMFGDVEITTAEDLGTKKDLRVVHPWIHPLLDQEFLSGAAALDQTTQALRLLACLRQPFGALVFEPVSRIEYRRVATDSLIMVQIREEVSLTELINNISTIEVQ